MDQADLQALSNRIPNLIVPKALTATTASVPKDPTIIINRQKTCLDTTNLSSWNIGLKAFFISINLINYCGTDEPVDYFSFPSITTHRFQMNESSNSTTNQITCITAVYPRRGIFEIESGIRF
ncbi:predicted protein [Botrytis cinerea T4]|uniref:Uncharacterized protein n=1 Tax=Botryotinia fuckeliana (strain T4) TaxID=999810 RepID=G2Y007_BOTF4|nr:predicted protein [Botrytis cinerea T4]